MSESFWHKQLKRKDAHGTGTTEATLPSGTRLDALSPTGIATEIERCGRPRIKKSVSTLKEALNSGVARKARLRVPNQDLDTAYKEMRLQRVGGELTNLSGSMKLHVPKRRK
jgi:hypothetical protein